MHVTMGGMKTNLGLPMALFVLVAGLSGAFATEETPNPKPSPPGPSEPGCTGTGPGCTPPSKFLPAP